ncbi:SUZ domain-containing protein [Mycena kentingensis (nom. inval.)]|nr:SUZ domain-containing protein [Mycena kentingensis (nom. inval.)]
MAVTSPSNDWDRDFPPVSTAHSVLVARPQPRPQAQGVPRVVDDWEDDEEEEEDGEESQGGSLSRSRTPPRAAGRNQRIWEAANTHTSAPMPTVVLARSSVSVAAPIAPAAFQPQLRILKRPTSASPAPAVVPTTPAGETLKEREARYQAARERIFGPEDPSAGKEKEKKGSGGRKSSGIARNPRGPADGTDTPQKGFSAPRTRITPTSSSKLASQ